MEIAWIRRGEELLRPKDLSELQAEGAGGGLPALGFQDTLADDRALF